MSAKRRGEDGRGPQTTERGCPLRIFFVSEEAIKDDIFTITGSEARHISTVLRYAVGDEISLADGNGTEYRGVIEEIEGSSVRGRIIGSRALDTEAPVEVTLIQGIPKGEKMELIVQKCTELGIKRIIPVNTERTISRYEGPKAVNKVERWRRIAMEAAKQSNRAVIPQIDEITDLKSGLASVAGEGLLLIPWEMERKRGIRDVISEAKGKAAAIKAPLRRIAMAIGPEGGFSSREVDAAVKAGAVPVSLGPRILRTETAGMALLSLIMYEFGGFDPPGGN